MDIGQKENLTMTNSSIKKDETKEIVFCNSLGEVREQLSQAPLITSFAKPLRTCWQFNAAEFDQTPLSLVRKTYLAMDVVFGERDMRIALVASDDLNFGMCRMLASFIERPFRLAQTFRDAADAIDWLWISDASPNGSASQKLRYFI